MSQDQTLTEWLARPSLIKQGVWLTSATFNDNLQVFSVATELSVNPMWQPKLSGFNLVRGTACVRIQLNATPFQAGRLILHYLPCANQLNADEVNTKNYLMNTKTQHPNVELDCRDTTATIRIPYVAPTAWYNLGVPGYQFDWGTVYLSVLSPLLSGAATECSYSVYMWFENFEFAAPVVPQMAGSNLSIKRKKKKPPVEQEAEDIPNGVISSTLRTVGDMAAVATRIPMISSFAGTLSWVMNAASVAAASLGYAKPQLESYHTLVTNKPLQYSLNDVGTDNTHNFGMSAVNSVALSDQFAGCDMDEMSFKYLFSIPAFIKRFEFNTTQQDGDIIFSLPLSPSNTAELVQRATSDGGSTLLAGYPPFSYVASNFEYYRGGITLIFKIIKTDYHSGRLSVSFLPLDGTNPTLIQTHYIHREIIDIRESNEFEITIPYLQAQAWLAKSQLLGRVFVHVVNELIAPTSVNSSLDVLVYAKAAEDFDVAVLTNAVNEYPVEIQMNEESGTLVKPIGSSIKNTLNLDYNAHCIGESIGSIKQLMLRSMVIRQSMSTATNSIELWPWFTNIATSFASTYLPGTTQPTGDYLSRFACGYTFMRGSIVFDVETPLLNSVTSAAVQRPGRTGNYAFTGITPFPVFTTTVATAFTGAMPIVCSNVSGGEKMRVRMPYYNKTPSTVIRFGTAGTQAAIDQPITWASFNSSTNFGTTGGPFLRRAVADDFQLGYFTGFPPVFLQANAP